MHGSIAYTGLARAYRRTLSRAAAQSGRQKGQRFVVYLLDISLELLHSYQQVIPFSYSKSKLTLLHSNAAPAPPRNGASSIGYVDEQSMNRIVT